MKYTRLTTLESVKDLIHSLNIIPLGVVLDVETTGLDTKTAELLDIQLEDLTQVYIFSAEFVDALKDLDLNVPIIGHNLKYDTQILARYGIDLFKYHWHDTMLTGHLLDENRDSYSLDAYIQEIWNDKYKEEFWAKYKSYEEAPQEDRDAYACRDVFYTRLLYRSQQQAIEKQKLSRSLLAHTHLLAKELCRTEIQGVKVDTEYLIEIGQKLKSRIDTLAPGMRSEVDDLVKEWEEKTYEAEKAKRKTEKGKLGVVKPDFNFASATQLKWLLYSGLKLPVQKNDKTKQVSTDYDALKRIADLHPVIPLIQEFRDVQKTYTAFIEGTTDRLKGGRIYPEFRVNGTVTGRISHSNPNLGQLPREGGIRGIYTPDPGNVFVSADYSQLEVVLEANLTKDKTLVTMLEKGESKHDITSRGLGVDRNTAKTLNFCLQYRGSHIRVAKLLGITEAAAQKVWDEYWKIYAGCRRLQLETDKKVEMGVPIETLFGRRRRFRPGRRAVWDKDLRMAYNFLIQGTGADVTSKAFYQIGQLLRGRGWGRAVLSVHDEIIIEVKKEVAEEAEQELLTTMTNVGKDINLTIPLKAEGSGPTERWED
jgi:DNA polymerase-1